MTRDMLLCKRILMQFVQSGQFSTDDSTEACHVALLKDRGYVEAQIVSDDCGRPKGATIGRMTATGYDHYEREFSNEEDGDCEIVSKGNYYNNLITIKRENELSRDKLIATIATGGIALCFGVASYFHGHNLRIHYAQWIATIIILAVVLIGRLISDHIGGMAIDKCVEQLGNPESDVAFKPTCWDSVAYWLNIANCVLVIAGIIAFAWFLLTSMMEV